MMRLSVHPGRSRALFASGCVLAALAAAPAAHASTVSETNGTLNVAGAPGEANNVTIAQSWMGLTVTDHGTRYGFPVSLNVGTGCWRMSSSTASCPRPTKGVTVNLGDGDDVVDLRDGVTDSLICGPGNDTGNAETADNVAADCEGVTKPAPMVDPPVTDPTTDPVVNPPATDPPVVTPAANSVPPTIPQQAVGLSASGVATVRVACPADSGGCKGVVTIALPSTVSPRHAKPVATASKAAPLKLGSATFKVAAGKSANVPIRLSKRGRQRILRGRTRRRVMVSVIIRAADGTIQVTTRNVTLHPPAKRKKHKAHK